MLNNQAYAFTTPDGLTCMIQRNGGYGCFGALPGAPKARIWSADRSSRTWLARTGGNPFAMSGDIKPLPGGSRLTSRQ